LPSLLDVVVVLGVVNVKILWEMLFLVSYNVCFHPIFYIFFGFLLIYTSLQTKRSYVLILKRNEIAKEG
jgi:hypothetical protein